MAWPAELEKEWCLLLEDLEETTHGFFLIEYDRLFTRDAILRRLQADFDRRNWELLKPSLSIAGFIAQLERALQERPARAALIRLDDAAARQFSALNLARERLYKLPAAIIFVTSQEAHTRLLQSAHDLATWIAPPFRFALPEMGLPRLPAPAGRRAPDLAAQIEYYREQVQQALEADKGNQAFDLLPSLADLYLSAEMYDAALRLYRALARRHEDRADEQQAILFTRRGDAAQGWRALADLQAGRLSSDDRLFLQRLLDEGLFAVRESPSGDVIADEMGRENPLTRDVLLTLRALSGSVATEAYDSAELTRLLRTRFDGEELRTFCFDLGVDYDDLPGEGKAAKARELVGRMERHDRIPELVEVGKRQRPYTPWEDALKKTVETPPAWVRMRDSATDAQRAGQTRALDRARRTLAILEERAAGYTVLTIPAHMVNEIKAKRKETARLESLLADVGQDGILPSHDTLPRRVSFFGREKEIARALGMARRILATLEEQAAGYTALTIPVHLMVELEDKQKEIARLESLLADVGQDGILPLPHDTLPRRVSFFGREKEIARALEALSPEDRGWGLMIDGIGGIGKTALAVEVAHLCLEQARFDAFFFTTAKLTRLAPSGEQRTEEAAITLDGMLNEIARAMDCQSAAQQAGAEKRRALLDELRRFSGPQRRVLLILDNLETLPTDELAPLFEFLRRLPQDCKAIVTSRKRAGEGAVWLRLGKLDWEPAKALIADRMGRDARLERTLTQASEARWQELYDAAGGSPLALLWALGLMSARHLSLDRALALLRGGADDDSPLHQFIYREARQDMGADDWRVLGALSLFAAPASFEALTNTTGLTRLMLESALERLDGYALVDAAGPAGPYSLHPLTRQLAAGELAAQLEMRDTLQARFARYWVDFAQRYGGHSKNYQTYHHLDAEWPNLEAAAEVLRNQVFVQPAVALNLVSEDKEAARMLNDLAHALRTFLWFRGHWEEWMRLSEGAYRAMAAQEDWRSAGERAYDVATIHYNRAETGRAAAWADRCAEAMERGGTRRDQATATLMRGLVARQRGDLDEAERLHTEALAAYRDLGEEGNQAIVLNDLGGVAQEQQEYDRAERYYREALALDEKIGNKEYQATRLGNLGNLALERGRPDEARRWFERALPLAQEVGLQELIAQAQWGLARVLEEEGRTAEALPLAQAALQIYERLRHKDLEEARQLVARLQNADRQD